ncbi:hypothetical protein RZN05_05105 [Sphingomonas sp. HF-S4]|uniref:Uncharacterized protein n=1 Tax=Sphingomonas agrestis TaxID=3080540 RepID=A0ABU3Y569_9SPHN|nr:hypothetical protein [Sphingomonas sp. HF-S4]MDV3456352.1 hypothetical protein [Sphingomonas sp. HF-S4]
MATAIDGIYAGYMSGSEGNGVLMFVFKDGIISGADPLGVLFDGEYTPNADGTVAATVKVTGPGGETVIQGASAGPSGLTYPVSMTLPADFACQEFIRVETPLGAVNLKLKKVRTLGDNE